MSAIAHFLESEGIATTGISLVRENTVAFSPPRFLWVPFPLGRPLGVPSDPAFQHRVIAHALSLLERTTGPVLEDFPEDPPQVDEVAQFACPVSFAAEPSAAPESWSARLCDEVAQLSPWYAAAMAKRARTSVGILAETPAVLASELGACLDATAMLAPQRCKHLLEDLKAYYLESMAAQPGAQATQLATWMWRDTHLGAAILVLHANMRDADDASTREIAAALLPRWVIESEFARDAGGVGG